jgi:hypothetical protein
MPSRFFLSFPHLLVIPAFVCHSRVCLSFPKGICVCLCPKKTGDPRRPSGSPNLPWFSLSGEVFTHKHRRVMVAPFTSVVSIYSDVDWLESRYNQPPSFSAATQTSSPLTYCSRFYGVSRYISNAFERTQ